METRILKTMCLTIMMVALIATVFTVAPASSPTTRGPKIDTLRWKVTRSPTAQLVEMTLGPPGGSDIMQGSIRPTDIETLAAQGKIVSSRSGMHLCWFGVNMRRVPLDDVNFRHALAHLIPKDKIIGTLFKYVTIRIDTPTPPAQALWYNPYVDPHSFSPDEAKNILRQAGYGEGAPWTLPGGGAMPTLKVYMPLEVVAPTSYVIGKMFVDEANAIGLTNIVSEPFDFAGYLAKVYDQWDFDIYWVCWSLGRFPTILYLGYDSSQNYLGSRNPSGISWPALDTELRTFYFGLDHSAKVAAIKKVQEMVMGSPTPAGDYYLDYNMDPTYQALAYFPVYSRNIYDMANPGLKGLINMFGYGTDNSYTYMNVEWTGGTRPGTTDKMVVMVESEYPETLNPTSGKTVYAWDFMGGSFDGLMATNAWSHRDEPWLATSWSYGKHSDNKFYIKYNVRTTDLQGQPIVWADGKAFAPSDVKFGLDFLTQWDPTRYRYFSDYIGAVGVVGNEVTINMTQTSQWFLYDMGAALQFPEQVWAKHPVHNHAWDSRTEVETFDPSAYTYPQAGNTNPGPIALPTQVFGLGPWILKHSTNFIATSGYGDLEANRKYWLTQDDHDLILTNQFHYSGDVNRDAKISILDLALVGKAFGSVPGMPRWNPDADITGPAGTPPDSKVDIDDLSLSGKYYGEKKTVP